MVSHIKPAEFQPISPPGDENSGEISVSPPIAPEIAFVSTTKQKTVERLRKEVMQMVSHDLRTPLATVGNVLSILEDGRAGDLSDKGKQLVAIAQRNVERLVSLVNDLLEVEKMKAGALSLVLEEVPLSYLFEEAMQSVSGWAQEHQVVIEAVPTNLEIFGDELRLVQVLVNLLANAIKFSSAGSRVQLSATETREYFEISVRDEGRGIPQDQLELIFERFTQVRLTDMNEENGTGLGLAICKAIVERHDGIIKAESVEGVGSVFTVQIPTNHERIRLIQLQG
jgi:signal transduction histidine kinase